MLHKGQGPGKEAIMQTNTGAPRHAFDGLPVDWDQLRTWKQKTLTKERVAEIALFATTATILGYVVWWAAKAAESYTMLGIG
jgi:hypothetical protein